MTVIITAKLGNGNSGCGWQNPALERLVSCLQGCGCLHHDVLRLGDEWWLIEEWESPEAFEDFFDRNVAFRRALRDAGFRELPDDVRLWRPIESTDEPRSHTLDSRTTRLSTLRHREVVRH